ncbi:hypothetical protein P3T76_003423 [Phytophthora citrophthora]|uniref:Uncharacterized protein n=1 Tax=Phytophthora citrophthora TaxID=4793 RepID=A0AAD9GU22_9STRA|nr:hypothetical protein P3T76_003423 [Phytophthora citrophthora]
MVDLSPTLCRPRHLDPERLRARLGSEKFDKLRYHEAAVVSTAPMQFQLFALSSDTLFIVPLMSRGEAVPDMSLPLQDISKVERVVPANKKQCGLLLLPTSQLFRLQLCVSMSTKLPSELFFSTFEPQTQLFFQLSIALRTSFQKQLIPRLQLVDNKPEQRLELTRLLEMLVSDLARAHNDTERSRLLDELTAAAYCSRELKKLFFEDRTHSQGCIGLGALLVRQFSNRLRPRENVETKVEFLLSITRLLGVMCFDMQPRTSYLELLAVGELVPNLLGRGAESYTVNCKAHDGDDVRACVLREDFMDAQASLLLALDAMQQYEDFRLHQHQQMRGLLIERSTSVMRQALQASAFPEWLPKFFKRLCIAMSRAAIAIEQQHELEDDDIEVEGGIDEDDDFNCREALEQSQILALWRCAAILELLLQSDVASGGDQVLGILLRTRKDCIDMYLRTPRFMTALSTSGISHLEDVALKLSRFLESLRDRQRGQRK